jgi:hypothetical protein
MTEQNHPLLVAVWPGMGQVASIAGYYLMSKLQMHEIEPIPARDLFDVEYVDVKDGLVTMGSLPRNRVFSWKDLVVFIGEDQPPTGKIAFCGRLLDYAQRLGVRQVFTFAAMGTNSLPYDAWRVYGISTFQEGIDELRRRKVEIMTEGQIRGLNGVFLAAAAQRGMRGIGLLGEMPGFAAQVPFPKASRNVLDVFAQMAAIEIDLKELDEYGRAMESQLTKVLERVQKSLQTSGEEQPQEETPEFEVAPPEPNVTDADRKRIENLFEQAKRDRTKTFELKRELDRLGVFAEYEDRFLDLFKRR